MKYGPIARTTSSPVAAAAGDAWGSVLDRLAAWGARPQDHAVDLRSQWLPYLAMATTAPAFVRRVAGDPVLACLDDTALAWQLQHGSAAAVAQHDRAVVESLLWAPRAAVRTPAAVGLALPVGLEMRLSQHTLPQAALRWDDGCHIGAIAAGVRSAAARARWAHELVHIASADAGLAARAYAHLAHLSTAA